MKKDANRKGNPFKEIIPPEGSTMEYGKHFEARMDLPFACSDIRRSIRVWLPEEYEEDGAALFPVMYMADGQNMVDAAFSAYGDWHLDRVIHALKEENRIKRSPILVGIDCPKIPKDRSNELCPPYPTRFPGPRKPIADKYLDFIVNSLKPIIEANFRVDKRREATAIGGSSMGGIMAFYGYFKHKETFGYAHAFSIPFFFYGTHRWEKILADIDADPSQCGKMTMYVGGEGFERKFVKGNHIELQYLRSLGFDESKILYIEDPSKPHHEEAWSEYSDRGLEFWLRDLD